MRPWTGPPRPAGPREGDAAYDAGSHGSGGARRRRHGILLGACDRGGERTGGGGKSITVVIAEYSKEHTKPFWQGLVRAVHQAEPT